jgi:DNA-binding NarL/FixJ family response regulator
LTDLTKREHDVLERAALGMTDSEIGAELYVSTSSVNKYKQSLLKKLGARNATQAVAIAIRAGKLA